MFCTQYLRCVGPLANNTTVFGAFRSASQIVMFGAIFQKKGGNIRCIIIRIYYNYDVL